MRDIDFTKPLSGDDAQYVIDRPWLATDAELRGLEVKFVDDTFTEDEDEDEGGVPDEVDYKDLSRKELESEITRRNAERDEDDQIVVAAPANKPELIAALEDDDESDDEPAEDDE